MTMTQTLLQTFSSYYGQLSGCFPPNINKKVAAQVALGVSYFHKCGIVHGNIHPKNVFFYSLKLQQMTIKELMENYGNPDQLMELYATAPEDMQVKICDFKESHIYNPQLKIEKPFQLYYDMDEEAEEFVSLSEKIFQYEPCERIDAEDIVRLLPSGWNERQEKSSRVEIK
ncbi:hypothetical protein BDQ17DRAFT_1331132 [Cyathus striatus]|nr:hypothetical protein BDQ17DRAFT_1331132 [Cyathus striatus]